MPVKKLLLTPIKVDWKEEGEVIEGLLVSKTSIDFASRKIGRYVIQDAEGVRWLVLGTTQLDEAMAETHEGMEVSITYLGTAKTSRGQTVKRFSVVRLVSEE